MSLFSWFSTKKKKVEKHVPPASSGLSRIDSTKPYLGDRNVVSPAPGQPANRKHERMARRELLYTVVREAMVRAGVLSSSYKFKVLSLDPRGRQFLVMVDLAQGAGSETVRLAEIEALIAQAAKQRHDILVSAVYWRSIEHVAVGDPAVRTAAKASNSRPTPIPPQGTDSNPVPLLETVSQPAELMVPPERERPSGPGKFDPLGDDEVAAFQRALSAGVTAKEAVKTVAPRIAENDAFARTHVMQRAEAAPHPSLKAKPPLKPVVVPVEPALQTAPAGAGARDFDGSGMHGPQSYTLLTGFEDTEMPDAGNLSATQYGDLR